MRFIRYVLYAVYIAILTIFFGILATTNTEQKVSTNTFWSTEYTCRVYPFPLIKLFGYDFRTMNMPCNTPMPLLGFFSFRPYIFLLYWIVASIILVYIVSNRKTILSKIKSM